MAAAADLRRSGLADLVAQITPCSKNTTAVMFAKIWDFPRNGRQVAGSFRLVGRITLEQSPGIGMTGVVKNLPHRAAFDHFSGIHHHNVITDLGDDAKVVRNKQD